MDSGSDRQYRIAGDELRRFARDVLSAAGVAEPHAETVATGLTRASLRGIDSHGVARLEVYVEKFLAGGFNPDPDITVEWADGSSFSVDADDGPGQSAAMLAMETALDLAADAGIAGGVVRNSNHFGTAAFYTQRAAEDDCIGLAMTNVGSDVVPFDGTEPYLGTNPMSFAIPTGSSYPITVDMATSVVAMGKIDHIAKETGEPIPDDWAVDVDGEPTTDPHAVAALRPMAGPKGYGLGLVVDVLCGLLSGMGPSPTVGPLYDEFDRPMRLGHFVGAIDVGRFRDVEAFKSDVDGVIEDLKAIGARTQEEVMLPGEIEANTRERREREGVPLPPGVYESLERLAERLDVPIPDLFRDDDADAVRGKD